MNHPFNAPPNGTPTEQTLDQLAERYTQAKTNLALAQAAVAEAEQAIIQSVGSRDEGAFTVHCDNYKVTTNQPVTRAVSKAGLEAIRREFPEDLFEAMFDYKPALNVKLFKECEHLRPEVYKLACKAVTSKMGKISVRVEALS